LVLGGPGAWSFGILCCWEEGQETLLHLLQNRIVFLFSSFSFFFCCAGDKVQSLMCATCVLHECSATAKQVIQLIGKASVEISLCPASLFLLTYELSSPICALISRVLVNSMFQRKKEASHMSWWVCRIIAASMTCEKLIMI
jgi:hypothetical protein